MKNIGEQFLHERDDSAHTSKPVEHEQERRKRAGEEVSQKPAEKLAHWMGVLEKTHMGHRDDPRVLERIKNSYHKSYVIEPENIPESYFDTQRQLAREQGHGDIEITDERKEQLTEVIVSDQKSTLNSWTDYFSSSDSDSFPMWAKYWAFTGMTKLSTFDKETHTFRGRSKNTVAPFPDINREALAYTIDAVVKKARKENTPLIEEDEQFKQLLQGSNFGKLYAYAIEKATSTEENELANIQGEWVKYDQNSNSTSLVQSLQGHGTGWCTAGENTAKQQLKQGNFFVYYSHNNEGEATIPRAAIRMEGNNIAEVRGISSDQNLDPYIGVVVEEKLSEFGTKGESYKKKTADMEYLTGIERRHQKGDIFTQKDLRFLYEIDESIEGFGYAKDPRINELLKDRDIKDDISSLFGISREEISTTEKEALSGGIQYHYGDLYLSSLTSAEGLTLPETIGGDLYLSSLTSAEGLTLPETIGGNLYLNDLTSAEGLTLPETIGGSLNLSDLTSAEGLTLPETIGDDLYLSSLTSAEGLTLPETIGGGLNLYGLTSAEGLTLPETIVGYLNLYGLTSAEGLTLPETIGGNLNLSGLTSAEGLTLPETIGGNLSLSRLTSAEKIKIRKKYPKLNILDFF